jgi:hypothetical protein
MTLPRDLDISVVLAEIIPCLVRFMYGSLVGTTPIS